MRITFLNRNFVPVSRKKATAAKILKDNGTIIFAVPMVKKPKTIKEQILNGSNNTASIADQIREATVKAHQARSKKGKIFNVRQHTRDVLSKYVTGGSYLSINTALRNGRSHPDVKVIDREIMRNKTPSNLTVYRSISAGIVVQAKVGAIVTDKGYFTASKSKTTALAFSPFHHGTIEIKVPKGTNYISLVPYQKAAYRESGVLFKRNSSVKITSERYEIHPRYGRVKILTGEFVLSKLKEAVEIDWDEAEVQERLRRGRV